MQEFEYRVIPAPRRGERVRGLKTPEERFAHAVMVAINAEAAQGWEYLRAERLPSEERAGFTRTSVNERHLLVFRRPVQTVSAARPAPRFAARAEEEGAPAAPTAAPALSAAAPPAPHPATPPAAPPAPTPPVRPGGRGLFGQTRKEPPLSPASATPPAVPSAPAAPAERPASGPLLSWRRKGNGDAPPKG
jgi:hypothetical protein